jgi:tetratricopeptide (TPR) repeat protein
LELAVPEYEALLRLNPTHYWGFWNLNSALDLLGRADEAVPVAIAWAQLRPLQPQAVMRVINSMCLAGQHNEAEPFVARVLNLLRGRENASMVPWLTLFPVERARVRLDALEAVDLLDRSRAPEDWSDAVREEFDRQRAQYYLGLGRPTDARRHAAPLRSIRQRVLLAEIAQAAGDIETMRRELTGLMVREMVTESITNTASRTLSLMIDAGLAAEVEVQIAEWDRLVSTEARPLGSTASLQGELALARSEAEQAVRLIEEERSRGRPEGGRPGPRFFQVRLALARAKLATGDPAGAADVLEEAVADRYRQPNGRVPGHALNVAMLMLADAYRALGNEPAAVDLEDELRQVLAAAEPDFPLAIELRARTQ